MPGVLSGATLKHPTHLTVYEQWDPPAEAAVFVNFINDVRRCDGLE